MMLQVRLSRFLNFQFGAFAVLLALIHSCGGQHHVIGSSHPVVATLGDDIILPCRLDPPTTALKLTVEWTRPDLKPRFVLVLRQNVELDNKHPAYEGRTSLFSEELKLGNISLKLSRVRTSDEGGYRCFVPELNREAAVQLVVGAASSPVIQMITNSSSIDLQCNSTGWYPEPEVFWLDGEGNLLSAGPPETVRGPDDLYTVSSRVTVEKRHSNNFTCRVTQKETNQTRETVIQVPADVVDVVPPGSSPTSPVPAIVGAVLGIIFILTVAAGCLLWKWRRNKLKNKRRSLEDGAEQPREEQTEEEEEEESVTLMSGREENNVNNESQSEYLELLAQTETQQDQLMITSELITDMGGGGAEGDNERVSLVQTERETHQQQEMMRRPEQNDCVKEERQEKKKPDKEDSELPTVSISEGQREQPHNLQTDQEEKKEEETQQEKIMEEKQLRREEDETEETSETKIEQKDNEQQREDSTLMRQKKIKKERSEQKQRKEERSRRMGQRDQSKKKVKDTMELKSQEDQEQGVNKLEPEDKKDKDQEGNQNDRTRLREEESENRKEERKETEEREIQPPSQRQEELQRVEEKNELQTQKKNVEREVSDSSKQTAQHKDKEENNSQFTGETERKADGKNRRSSEKLKKTDVKNLERSREPQLEKQEEPERVEVKMKLPAQKKNYNQEVLDKNKQETGHEDKRSEGQETKLQESSKDRKKNQSKDTRKTERKTGGENRQRNEKLERTDVKKEEGVNPSVSPAGPDRPDLRAHQETAERNKQEVQQVNELQTEKQQRDEPQRNERESKEQPERSAEVVEVEGKGGQEERTDGGADRDETNKTCEETEKHRPLQSEVKEETGEQLKESSKDLTLRGAESLDVVMEEEIDRNPVIHVTYGNVKRRTWKWKEQEVLHVRQRYSTQLGQRRIQRRQNKTIIWSMKKQQQRHKKNEAIYELSLLVPPSFHQHTVHTEEDVKMTNQDVHMDTDEDESDEHRMCEPLSFHQHTAQTEEDRKMTKQDIHRDSDEAAAAPHSQQEVISESKRLDYDSDLDRSSVCSQTKKSNILSCTAF